MLPVVGTSLQWSVERHMGSASEALCVPHSSWRQCRGTSGQRGEKNVLPSLRTGVRRTNRRVRARSYNESGSAYSASSGCGEACLGWRTAAAERQGCAMAGVIAHLQGKIRHFRREKSGCACPGGVYFM